MTPRTGQTLEAFCNAWQKMTEDCMALLRSQDSELVALRRRLQEETDRADYWHALAVNSAPAQRTPRPPLGPLPGPTERIPER